MTSWRQVTHRVQDRIKNGITNILIIRQLRLRRQRLKAAAKALPESKIKSKSKQRKKVISPQEAVAIIGSMVIVLMGLGGLGLVHGLLL